MHKQYAAAAGLDVENPEPLVFGEKLVAAVKAGAVEPQAIDQACRRILTVIYGKPVIVVIIAGSAVIVESWLGHTNAVLQTFYSGMEGGTALAKLLFGDVSPSGKLPFTVAKAEKDYPPFDKNADRIEYGYYHGYTLFEREGRAPRFPFGHGLSDTTFAYRALKLRRTNVEVTLSVANTGKVSADEVVLFYASFPAKAVDRPNRLLKAFARVSLAPGETKAIRREILLKDLMWRDATTHTWKLETGSHKFSVGTLAAAVDL